MFGIKPTSRILAKFSACLSAHFCCMLTVTKLHCINPQKVLYHGVQILLTVEDTHIQKLYPLGSCYIELKALAEPFLENSHYWVSDMDLLLTYSSL